MSKSLPQPLRQDNITNPSPTHPDFPNWIDERIHLLHQLLLQQNYKGNDPFDLVNSPFLKRLPDIALLQLLVSKFGSRLAPDFLRKLLRVPPIEDPKIYACAYFGYRFSGKKEFQPFADEMIDRIIYLATETTEGVYWGYDYKWATLGDGINPRGASTLVPASFAILALICESLLKGKTGLCEHLKKALAFYHTHHLCQGKNGPYMGYFRKTRVNTHNANLLGSAALSAGAFLLGNKQYFKTSLKTARTSLAAVKEDGFLPYTDAPAGNWTDSFHHLYGIACLSLISRINPFADTAEFDPVIRRLKAYYRKHFIRPEGRINYYPDEEFPVDCHNYAAAIIYAILFEDGRLMGEIPVEKLLAFIDQRTWMPRQKRYLHRIYKFKTDRRFFLRWNQAWMFWALSMVRNYENQRSTVFQQIQQQMVLEN